MAKKTELPKSINLLNPINKPADIWTKSYNWITKIGRYILVFVEIIVLGVFISRFVLDKRNNDLTEDINDTVTTLKHPSLKNYEVKFKQYHKYLDDIQVISENQKLNSQKLSIVLDTLPKNMDVNNISFNQNSVSLSLKAQDFEDISEYTTKINDKYEDVKVNLSKKGEKEKKEELDGINVSISFKFEKEEE